MWPVRMFEVGSLSLKVKSSEVCHSVPGSERATPGGQNVNKLMLMGIQPGLPW